MANCIHALCVVSRCLWLLEPTVPLLFSMTPPRWRHGDIVRLSQWRHVDPCMLTTLLTQNVSPIRDMCG